MSAGRAQLYLKIPAKKKDTFHFYSVVPLKTDASVAVRAWRLRKAGQKRVYDISVDAKGWVTCSCADSTFRTHGRCKHASALKELGLLLKMNET